MAWDQGTGLALTLRPGIDFVLRQITFLFQEVDLNNSKWRWNRELEKLTGRQQFYPFTLQRQKIVPS